ncbi:MAG: FecR domain-containing protein [Acidobacteria bacterium]|nr:FecR domain-containing protein [Acidobacteriota bacterium]
MLFWLALLAAHALVAQDSGRSPAPRNFVHHVQGQVLLNGVAIDDTAPDPRNPRFPELGKDSVLRTELGLAEVMLAPGVVLRMGESSGIRATGPAHISLEAGAIVVEAADTKRGHVTVHAGGRTVAVIRPGIYRIGESGTSDALLRWTERRSRSLSMASASSAWMLREDRRAWKSPDWLWNPYFGMFSYVPSKGQACNQWGHCYYAPDSVFRR